MKNLGLSSALDLHSSTSKNIKAISTVNQVTGLSGLSNVFEQQQLFLKSVGLSSSFGLSAIQSMQNSFNSIKKQASLFQHFSGEQFSEIVKLQEPISKRMTTLSALSFSDNMLKNIGILKNQTIPNLSKALTSLSSIQQQLKLGETLPKYLTNSLDFYIRQGIGNQEYEVKNIIEDMENVSSKLNEISESQNITNKDITFINATLKKGETSAFIYFVIQIVFAILFSLNTENSKQSNVNITIGKYEKKELEKGFKETLKILSVETRKARTNVNLRSKPNSNSAKIGLVKTEQAVIVQKINHKWIRIIYQDDEYIIHSGWVYKKYFDKIN
jgi:Bacterial SH3 domain